MTRTDFDRALTGATFDHPSGPLTCEVIELGEIPLRSGQIALVDPFAQAEAGVLMTPVAAGAHRVGLVVTRGAGAPQPALGLVQLGEGKVDDWIFAGQAWANGGLVGLVDASLLAALAEVDEGALQAAVAPAPGGYAGILGLAGGAMALLPAPTSGHVKAWWGVDAAGDVLAMALDHQFLVVDRTIAVRLPLGGPYEHEHLSAAGFEVTAAEPQTDSKMNETLIRMGADPIVERAVVQVRGPDADVSVEAFVGNEPVNCAIRVRYEEGGRRLSLCGPELPPGAEIVLSIPTGREAL